MFYVKINYLICMSCSRPWLIKTDKFSFYTHSNNHYVPCGYCLNCRVDKQNQLQHRCEYELINFKCGAFVTLTYDDYHIVDKLRNDSEGNLVATLSKKDLQLFLYRLRQNIKRKMPDNILSNHHFKYLAVGEYGGDGQIFDRPHLHILFFGLDFAVCKKIFMKSWQGQGNIKVLPILEGGIAYCLKYLDKQLFGNQAEQKYDNNNLERPFQTHSLGLGSKLYEEQLNYIKSHDNCYRWKGKNVPVPPYYKNKFYIKSRPELYKINADREQFKLEKGFYPKNTYDLHDYKITKSELREQNINFRNRLHGRPLDFTSIQFKKTLSEYYIKDLVNKAGYISSGCPF